MSQQGGPGNRTGNQQFSGPMGYNESKVTIRPLSVTLPIQEPLSAVQKGTSSGTFKVVQAPLKSAPTYSSKNGSPIIFGKVGGSEIRDIRKERQALEVELEAERARAKVLEQVIEHALEFQKMSAESEKLRALALPDPTIKLLEQAEEEASTQLSTIHSDPSELRLTSLLEVLQQFENAIDKAHTESQLLPVEKTEAEEAAELQKEILDLTFEVETVLKEAEGLEDEIDDNTVRIEFANAIKRLERLFANLKRTPEKGTRDDFLQVFTAFQQDLEATKEYIGRHPKPPTTPATPVVPPDATLTGAFKTWPLSIKFEGPKNNKKWVRTIAGGAPQELPDQEMWNNLKKVYESVFGKYQTFFAKDLREKLRVCSNLITTKNKALNAIADGNADEASAHLLSLQDELERWENAWKLYQTVLKAGKTLSEYEKRASKELEVLTPQQARPLQEKINTLQRSIEKLKETILTTQEVSEEDVEKLLKNLTSLEGLIANYETTSKATNRNVLRPIKVTDKNKHQTIDTRNGRTITLEQYNAERGGNVPPEEQITITNHMDDDWPELRALGYAVGSKVSREWFKQFEHRTMYARQYARDKNDFLKRFTVPILDEKTNTVRYVESKLFKAQNRTWTDDTGKRIIGTQDVIRDILESDGIILQKQNQEEKKVEVKGEHEKNEDLKAKHRVTYHPIHHRKGSFFKDSQEGIRKGYFSTASMAGPQLTPAWLERHFETIKAKREKYLDDSVNYRFTEQEGKIQALLEEFKQKPKDGKLYKKIVSSLEAYYDKDAKPLIEAKKHTREEEEKLPADPLEKAKREQAIKTIDAIIAIRTQEIKKKTGAWKKYALALLCISLAGIVTKPQWEPYFEKNKESTPELPKESEDAFEHELYLSTLPEVQQEFGRDLRKNPVMDLIKKRVPSDKNDFAQDVYTLPLKELFTAPTIALLSPEQRLELSNMVFWAYETRHAKDNPGVPLPTFPNMKKVLPPTHYTDTMTIGQYLEETKKKIS